MPNDASRVHVICGIGDGPAGRRSASFAASLVDLLGARLTPVQLAAMPGDPGAALISLAAAEEADLVVIGARDHAGPGTSLGSVFREVVMRASCPVIVLPWAYAPHGPDAPTQRVVLCAFDGSDDARAALTVAATLAARLAAIAFVAHVGPGSFWQLEARARAQRAAMIVAASSGWHGWDASLPGSPAARLATSGATPVLFVPPGCRGRAHTLLEMARDGRHTPDVRTVGRRPAP